MGKTLWAVIALLLLLFGIWSGISIWGECREAGHSVMYCMRMVTR